MSQLFETGDLAIMSLKFELFLVQSVFVGYSSEISLDVHMPSPNLLVNTFPSNSDLINLQRKKI